MAETSFDAKLAAGTVCRFSTEFDTPVYTEVKGITSYGALGLTAEAKDKTTLRDTSKKYGRGIFDAPDKSIKGYLDIADTDQDTFIALCKAGTPFLFQVELPAPEGYDTGLIGTFEFQPLGFEMDEATAEDWQAFTIAGKQNSMDWTPAVVTP